MTKQEQIKEMQEIIGDCWEFDSINAELGSGDGYIDTQKSAETLYSAGYRKVPNDVRELIDVLAEGVKLKEKLNKFATNLKTHILAVMLSSDKTTCDDISNAKVILYYINRQLNDTFGLNEPLNASNQFLAEPDLVKKYHIDELSEVNND